MISKPPPGPSLKTSLSEDQPVPDLQLRDIPAELYRRLQHLGTAHRRTPEAEALAILQAHLIMAADQVSQAELLAALKHGSFLPPPGTPESVELLREDRAR